MLRIRIRKLLASLDQDPQKYADPRIRIQKLKKKLLQKPKSELLKMRDFKIFLNSEWFIKLKHKNKRTKQDKKFEISVLVNKIQ